MAEFPGPTRLVFDGDLSQVVHLLQQLTFLRPDVAQTASDEDGTKTNVFSSELSRCAGIADILLTS